MGLMNFLNNSAETSELHSTVSLRSRYYKANYTKTKNEIINLANHLALNVGNVDDAHGEILLQSNKYHIIATVIQVNPIETSVDFKLMMYSIAGFNRPQKKIKEMYDYLDSKLQFKGVGLHP